MRFVLTWLILAGLWLGLSGHFDAIHLTWGVVAVTLVSALSSRYLFGPGSIPVGAARLFRLATYVPWLLWQITVANVDVLLRVVGIRSVDPHIFRFRPKLHSDFGRATLANSITLTPGTVTVEIEEDGSFLVHAIAPEVEDSLLEGGMERRARWVEGEA